MPYPVSRARATVTLCLVLALALLMPGAGPAAAPQLMLATVWGEADDPAGWWLSEKYDGVRGYWDGERMLTRGGEVVTLPDTLRAALPPFPLDGELWAGRGRFAQTLSVVRDRTPGPGWEAIRYLVFDAPDVAGGFETRLEAVARWLARRPAARVRLAEQVRCRDRAHLQAHLAAIEAQGGEGVMLRAAGSPYAAGRSEWLRKYKSFEDREATVVGYNPGRGKYTGLVGSLLLELPDGTRFAVGSGLSDAERHDPPPLGSSVTFKYYGWTRHGKPRFPVFWRVRETAAINASSPP